MDSNVSKNTNSHNFFKLRVDCEKLDISVRDLLSKELLSSLTLYQQQLDVKIEHSWLATIIKNKTAISNHKNNTTILSENGALGIASAGKFIPIVYGCPLGLSLTTTLQQSPAIIVKRVGNLLILRQKNKQRDCEFELLTERLASGWINFYLDAKFIGSWLSKLFARSPIHTKRLRQDPSLDRHTARLLPVQYLHARCCSLLALGAREKLLVFDFDSGCLKYPEAIAWLDEQQNLWFKEAAEYNLIRQLLIVTDAWVGDNNRQWAKLALNLSRATDIFMADCRFLGKIKAEYPQLAIARLGLIALVKFWLEKILRTKLNLPAPQSM